MNVYVNFLTIKCGYFVKMTAKKSVEAKVAGSLKTCLDKDTAGSNISVSRKQNDLLFRKVLYLWLL